MLLECAFSLVYLLLVKVVVHCIGAYHIIARNSNKIVLLYIYLSASLHDILISIIYTDKGSVQQ